MCDIDAPNEVVTTVIWESSRPLHPTDPHDAINSTNGQHDDGIFIDCQDKRELIEREAYLRNKNIYFLLIKILIHFQAIRPSTIEGTLHMIKRCLNWMVQEWSERKQLKKMNLSKKEIRAKLNEWDAMFSTRFDTFVQTDADRYADDHNHDPDLFCKVLIPIVRKVADLRRIYPKESPVLTMLKKIECMEHYSTFREHSDIIGVVTESYATCASKSIK